MESPQVQALQSAMQGTFPPTQAFLVLLGYAAVFWIAAVRFFRWE